MVANSLIRKRLILLLVLLFSSIASISIATAKENRGADIAKDILHYINQYREKKGLRPLENNITITEAARKHSLEMANREVPFGHAGFEERLKSLMSVIRSNAAAENVAYGNLSAKQVVDLWLHSAGHRRNIEGNYNLTGIGIAPAPDGTLYFTEIFLHKTN